MHCKNCTTVKNKTKNKNKEIKQNKPKQKKTSYIFGYFIKIPANAFYYETNRGQ